MNVSDFIVTTKALHPMLHEALIKSKEPDSITFGIVIQSNQPPPDEWVIAQYINNPSVFFIEAEQVTATKPVVVVAQPLLTASAGPSNP